MFGRVIKKSDWRIREYLKRTEGREVEVCGVFGQAAVSISHYFDSSLREVGYARTRETGVGERTERAVQL